MYRIFFLTVVFLIISIMSGPASRSHAESLSGFFENGFLQAGPNHQVNAIIDFQGRTIIGGQFSQCGASVSPRIAQYDDALPPHLRWQSMGEGFNGTVKTLSVFDGKLFAGGYFQFSGSTEVGPFAFWDGSHWQQVSDSLNDYVLQLVTGNNELFILTNLDSQRYVHSWNGTELTLIAEADTTIQGMMYDGQTLWLHGDFHAVNGVAADYLAAWDGTQIQPGPTGLSEPIQDLIVDNGQLIALGPFSIQSTYGDSAVAIWNGETWEALGVLDSYNLSLMNLEVHSGEIFLSASRYTSWETPPRAPLLHLVDNHWVNFLPSFGNSIINTLFSGADGLWIGGQDIIVEGRAGRHLALWQDDQEDWSHLFEGSQSCNGAINSFAVFNQELVVGGIFSSAGPVWSPQRARWNGAQWAPMHSFGPDTPYGDYWIWPGMGEYGGNNHLQTVGDQLVCSGDLSEIWWDYFHGLWDEDNQQWILLDDWLVSSSLNYGSDLIETGGYPSEIRWRTDFNTAPHRIDDVNGNITQLVEWRGMLVAVGEFSSIGDFPVKNVAVFDDGVWSQIWGEDASWLTCALVMNNNLYVAGFLNTAGGQPVSNIAVWNGTQWDSLGLGVNNLVWTMIESNGYLIAGGNFSEAGAEAASGVAAWKDDQWFSLGEGILGRVYAMSEFKNALYIGGEFSRAGGLRSDNLACWHFNGDLTAADETTQPGSTSLTVAPNPANPRTEIRFTLDRSENVFLKVYDIRGQIIRDFSPGVQDQGEHRWLWNGRDNNGLAVASGVYLIKLEAGTTMLSRKVLFVR